MRPARVFAAKFTRARPSDLMDFRRSGFAGMLLFGRVFEAHRGCERNTGNAPNESNEHSDKTKPILALQQPRNHRSRRHFLRLRKCKQTQFSASPRVRGVYCSPEVAVGPLMSPCCRGRGDGDAPNEPMTVWTKQKPIGRCRSAGITRGAVSSGRGTHKTNPILRKPMCTRGLLLARGRGGSGHVTRAALTARQRSRWVRSRYRAALDTAAETHQTNP
jgi:hypothetical protein